jgi:phospholipid transport system transporter-binding protein
VSQGAAVVAAGADRCAIEGPLTFGSAQLLWKQLLDSKWLENAATVDLSGIGEADSAGLALLVAWRARREAHGGSLKFEHLPERLIALAKLTQAQSLLEA